MALKPLNQQTIVLTGATSGIGLATAEIAAEQGVKLVIAARNAEELEATADRLRSQFSAEIEAVTTDVADPDAVTALSDAAIRRFGSFDSWINNAAAAVYGTVMEIPLEDHRRVFDVGYFGVVHGSLAAAAHLRGKGGAIINVGSVLSERTMIYQGAYSAMKHAVKGFTDALRMEQAAEGTGVSVTLIKPAGMNTPYPEHARNYLDKPARIPPVVYDPRLVARAILHACATPKREITIGGVGWMIEKFGNLAPTPTDIFMQNFGKTLQSIRKAPPFARADNLFRPREDGSIESDQPIDTRRTSLFLEAQLRPVLATSIIAAVTGLAIVGLSGGWSRRDSGRPRSRLA